jgi:hypothetical protein
MSIREAENMPHVETEKEFYVKKLEEVADVFHADVTFYEGLYEYISKRNFPGPEILDILVYRDVPLGEELFPTKDSVLAYLKEKVQTLKRQRDGHMRLAQIVFRVEDEQLETENVVEDEVQVVNPPEIPPEEVIDADDNSTFSFDTQ